MGKFWLKSASISVGLVLAACASSPGPVMQNENARSGEPVLAPLPAPQPQPTQPQTVPRQTVPVQPVAPRVITPAPTAPNFGSIDDFVFSAGGDPRVYFAYDQHDLSPQARERLRAQAQWLQRFPRYTAIIEGHADERGTRQYNIALGAKRANSVRDFLVSLGVEPTRLTTVSYGKERPIDPRSNPEGWSRNRNGYTNLRPIGPS